MYRIVPDEAVDEQLDHLPRVVLSAYAEVLAALEITPEGGLPYDDGKPDGPLRQYVFGPDGRGLVTYLVLSREREVHILLVDWFG